MSKVLQLDFYFVGDDSTEDSMYNDGDKHFTIDADDKELYDVIEVLLKYTHKKFLYHIESSVKNQNRTRFQTNRILKWLCEYLDIDAIENQVVFDDLIKVCTNYDIWSTLVYHIKDRIQEFGEPEDYFNEDTDLYELMVNTPSNQMEFTKLLTNIHNSKGGKHV